MPLFHLLVLLLISLPLHAQSPTADPEAVTESAVLTVGTKIAPPFVIERPDGELAGISIDLWRAIARDAGWQFEFQQAELPQLVAGTAAGDYDLAVAALTATAEREARLDFAHPFFSTGLAIAVPLQQRSLLSAVTDNLFSKEFFGALSGLLLLLLIVGIIVWLAERRRNPEQFGGDTATGIGSGLWWAAVTMTTVGYGDKAPTTLLGRAVGLVWMFAAIIVISGFTAAIASSLTVEQMGSSIHGPADLRDARVASVPASSSASYLEEQRIGFSPVDTVELAMQRLAEGRTDAVVYDAPILQFLVERDYQGELRVLPGTFARQDYAIALPTGSPLREELNRVLLEKLGSREWNDIRYRYLGD